MIVGRLSGAMLNFKVGILNWCFVPPQKNTKWVRGNFPPTSRMMRHFSKYEAILNQKQSLVMFCNFLGVTKKLEFDLVREKYQQFQGAILSRWCFQIGLISPPILGEMIQFDEHKSQPFMWVADIHLLNG